ncbi:hypothetical protein [Frigoriflavimonas asaccharolytica]|uniref:Uncharacterized protein n=1 Tax=Frigoriflavimonas asaccharolytica TaxID=2735899 RepID=A0A8J8G9K8_9FLAO|nr:hypothetical protein [Frigoriflavimonas asaccharolytica]NRS93836.1 hypothetical protein [Frigoriflavimonas asaccharolytica]
MKSEILTQINFAASKFKKVVLKYSLIFLVIFSANSIEAQEKMSDSLTDDYQAFTFGLHLKNMHTWHGFVVTPAPMLATNLEYSTRDKKFTVGVWGGAGFAGTDVTNKSGQQVSAPYKEFSLYTLYRFSDKFFVEAVSHNNYTGVEERGDVLHYWSYDKRQGYNFVDLNFGYQVSKNTSLYLATILGGGSGDYQVQSDGSLKDSYTHYLEVKSKVWEKGNSNLSLFVGGAYSFVTDKTFYTEGKGNIINVGAALSKKVKLGNYVLPVEVTAMWNPEKQKTVLQVDLAIF